MVRGGFRDEFVRMKLVRSAVVPDDAGPTSRGTRGLGMEIGKST